MPSQSSTKAATILAVAAAGVVVVVLTVHRHGVRHADSRAEVETAVPTRAQDPQTASLDRFRLAEIENRLTAIEGGAAQKSTARPAPLPARLPNQEERARQIKQDFDEHQQRLNQSAAEPRNDAWAAPMEQKINAAFQKIPEGMKARYNGVDCRSTTCAVNFVWPSRDAAEGELRAMVQSLATTGCTRELALPPPDGRNSETTGQLLLMCPGANGTTSPIAGN